MALIKGMGTCAIPNGSGGVCGRQIGEGEAIGTITTGFGAAVQTIVGHKRCADAHYARKQESAKKERLGMVKRIDQSGPGGAIDPRTERDAIIGSSPLEKPEKKDLPPVPEDLAAACKQAGIPFIGDVPEDASPEAAYHLAETSPEVYNAPATVEEARMNFEELAAKLPNVAAHTLPPTMAASQLPHVDTYDGLVRISRIPIDPSGFWHLDPEDGEDLIKVLEVAIQRAWRQRR